MTALGTRTLTLSVGGTDYTAQVSKATIEAAETSSDFVSFADAAAGGGRDYTLNLTMTQDTATSSLWNMIWASAGTDVAVILKPQAGAVSASNPSYSMTANVREPDGTLLGGEANASTTAKFTVEVAWPLAAKPTKVVA